MTAEKFHHESELEEENRPDWFQIPYLIMYGLFLFVSIIIVNTIPKDWFRST